LAVRPSAVPRRWSAAPRSILKRRSWLSARERKFILSVRQGLRPDAQAVIAALKARGIGIEILSGDREPAVKAAAHALSIPEWRAGVTPADKIARIEELKRRVQEC
jgi:Cu2+-exporting ATPase